MPEIGAEGLLAFWDQYPELLPACPPLMTYRDVLEREQLAKPCCHCGRPSEKCMIAAHGHGGYRFVDLCRACTGWIQQALQRTREGRQE